MCLAVPVLHVHPTQVMQWSANSAELDSPTACLHSGLLTPSVRCLCHATRVIHATARVPMNQCSSISPRCMLHVHHHHTQVLNSALTEVKDLFEECSKMNIAKYLWAVGEYCTARPCALVVHL